MLNFFLKHNLLFLLMVFFFIFFFKKLMSFRTTYDILFFLFLNIAAISTILIYFNLENYFGFIFLSEISAIFIISILLVKSKFFFKKDKSFYILTTLLFFYNYPIFNNFTFFNFYKKSGAFNDILKLFYFLNTYVTSSFIFIFVIFLNFFLFFFIAEGNFGVNLFLFFKKSFIFKNKISSGELCKNSVLLKMK